MFYTIVFNVIFKWIYMYIKTTNIPQNSHGQSFLFEETFELIIQYDKEMSFIQQIP